jgi:DNA (cytosine-5)-methyltransferase 1
VFENPAGIGSLGELGSLSEMGVVESQELPDIEAVELSNICRDIEAKGYEVQPVYIPACAVGAPHERMRIFVICHAYGGRLPGQYGRRAGEITEDRCLGNESASSNSESEFERARLRESEPAGQRERRSGNICSENKLNPDSKESGLQRPITTGRGSSGRLSPEYYREYGWAQSWFEVAARLCTVDAGLTSGLAGLGLSRVTKLKMLGNCNPPQLYYPTYRAIAEIENGVTK